MRRKGRGRLILSCLVLICCLMVVLYGTTQRLQEKQKPQEKTAVSATAKTADEPGELYAQSAVLMDADSGRILFGKNETKARPMASTTKIMTCILALEQMEEDQIAVASRRAARQPKVRLGVQEGEKFYVRDLLYSLMLESHNDSAVLVAEAVGGSVEEFAQMMNDKAEEIGCEDTHFVTPNGLDDSDEGGVHATTAADLSRIMRYCIMQSPKRKEFLEITRTQSFQFADLSGGRSFGCSNHNAFLGMMEGALTGKTGFTGDAGYCYVGALRRGKRTFIVSLLACGWPNNRSYKWKDTRTLMEYGLEHYEYRPAAEPMEDLKLPVSGGADPGNSYALGCSVAAGMRPEDKAELSDLQVLLKEGETVTTRREVRPSLSAPVRKGETVGAYVCLLDGEEIRRYDVVTLESAERRDVAWCLRRAIEWFLL